MRLLHAVRRKTTASSTAGSFAPKPQSTPETALAPRVVHEPDGTVEYWADGVLHRDGGPAIERPDGASTWLFKGVIHRDDGPAVRHADGTVEYWLAGERFDDAERFRVGLAARSIDPRAKGEPIPVTQLQRGQVVRTQVGDMEAPAVVVVWDAQPSRTGGITVAWSYLSNPNGQRWIDLLPSGGRATLLGELPPLPRTSGV